MSTPNMASTNGGQPQTNASRRKPNFCGQLCFGHITITKQPDSWIYFAIYCLIFALDGFTIAFPGAVYLELQKNLNASTSTMSWIFSTMTIGYMIASVVYGYSADHMKEIHRLHAPIILIHSLCLIYVPYCTNSMIIFVMAVFMGFGWAVMEINEVLFTFRLYPMSEGNMVTWAVIIAVVFGALTPIFFEISITYFDSIEYPFIIFGVVGIVHSILVLFLKTPQHDALRSIKKAVSKSSVVGNSPSVETPKSPKKGPNDIKLDTLNNYNGAALNELARSASIKLNETENYQTLQNVTIIFCMLTMMVEGCVIRGYLSFIATYCVDYLGIHESWSRYYIVCIYASYAAYRTAKYLFFPNFSAIIQVTACCVLRLLFGIIFIFYGNDVISLFVIYILVGLSGAPMVPSLLVWGESIKATTGLISCSWWIFSGIGDASMSFALGSLIEKYGPQIMPVAVATALGVGLFFNICAVFTSSVLKRAQTKVFAETMMKMSDIPSCNSEIGSNVEDTNA